MASPAKVTAERVRNASKPLPKDLRNALGAVPDEPIAYRRVQLAYGGHVLSEADNWYLPNRLTKAMNATLNGTDTPFGKVVQPLHLHRSTLTARLLWSRLPEDWELSPSVLSRQARHSTQLVAASGGAHHGRRASI